MYRIAIAVSISAVLVLTAGSVRARAAFPGASGLIAFVNDRNGSPSIFTMNPDGTSITKLVPNQPQGAYPAWSPGGQVILFSVPVSGPSQPAYELWSMSANAGHLHRFLPVESTEPISSSWSPDKKKIALYDNGYLWVVRANGSGLRRVARASFSDAAPSWSRRGEIAFDRDGSIWVVKLASGAQRNLGAGGQPSWSPDGRRIVFSAVPTGANDDLYMMKSNGRGRHRLTKTSTVNETQPQWSPDGRWIAYSAKKGVYVMRSDGRSPRLAATKGWQPNWAPGSGKIVYSLQTPQWDGLVFTVDRAGLHRKQLLHPHLDAGPQWSPDGSHLAFSRDGVVHIVNADGSNLHSLGVSGADPAWSPDGSVIVVSSKRDLILADPAGGVPSRLHLALDPAAFVSVSDPDWSPDGARIALVASETSGTRDLYLVTSLGGSPTLIQPACGSSGVSSPSWAPNGNFIAMGCDQSIAVVYPDGSNLVPVGSATDASLAWSPDGSQIVYSDHPGGSPAQLFVTNSDGSLVTPIDTGPGSSDQPDWQPLPGA